jgi:2-dehydropantoate 2-reductase
MPQVERKSVLVVGCGGIGGIYAARLSSVADVIGLDSNREHVGTINRRGLRLIGRSEALARFPAYADPAELSGRSVDAVLLMVKSHATGPVFGALRGRLARRPLLATLQNGLGNAELLASLCDWDIVQGASMEAGSYRGPGEIEHLLHGETSAIGPLRGPLGQARWLGDLLNSAGLPTQVVDDPRGVVWAKFIFNCVMNPLGAIVLGENRARYEVPEVAELIDRMFEECEAVARAEGIKLAFDPALIVRKTRAGELPLSRHAGSMARDIAHGRETELEALTGTLVRKARSLGMEIPITDTVYRIAKGIEYAARVRVQSQ